MLYNLLEMSCVKGSKKTGGRKKGTPNKVTLSAKNHLEKAFDKLGGVDALVEWGKTDKANFYRIWAKLLPREIKADVDVNISLAKAMELAAKRLKSISSGKK